MEGKCSSQEFTFLNERDFKNMALLKSSADVLTGKCPFGLSVGAPSLFCLLWPVSLADTKLQQNWLVLGTSIWPQPGRVPLARGS